MEIQREVLGGAKKSERIRELALATMNKEFMFKLNDTKASVMEKLAKKSDFWWVPVLDQGEQGILVDVIHARVFWDAGVDKDDAISDILKKIDQDTSKMKNSYGKLHGPSFFMLELFSG